MKILELMNETNIGKRIQCTSEDNLPEVQIISDMGDILLASLDGKPLALSLKLMQSEWELVEPKVWDGAIMNSEYYYIAENGIVKTAVEAGSLIDSLRYTNNNYLLDKEYAKQISKEEFIHRSLLKFRDLNEDNIDWNNKETEKFSIVVDLDKNDFSISTTTNKKELGVVYFSTKELALAAVEILFKELKEFYL